MTLDKSTAAKLREMNLPLIEEFAKARRATHSLSLETEQDPIVAAEVRGKIAESRFWSRLSEAVEAALK